MGKPRQADFGTHTENIFKCVQCNVEKNTKKFQYIKDTVPAEYANICKLCFRESLSEYDAAQVRKRVQEKADKQAERALARKRKAEVKNNAKQQAKRKEEQKRVETAAAKADRELASRVLAKRRLLHFIQKFVPKYEAGWVHQDICARLERFF